MACQQCSRPGPGPGHKRLVLAAGLAGGEVCAIGASDHRLPELQQPLPRPGPGAALASLRLCCRPRADTLCHGTGSGRAHPPGRGSHRRLVDQAPPPGGPERVLPRWPGPGYFFHHPALAPPVGQRAPLALRAISLALSLGASLLRQPGHRLLGDMSRRWSPQLVGGTVQQTRTSSGLRFGFAQATFAGLHRRWCGVGGGCYAGPEA